MPGFLPGFDDEFLQVIVNNEIYLLARLLLLAIPIKQLPDPQQRGVSASGRRESKKRGDPWPTKI